MNDDQAPKIQAPKIRAVIPSVSESSVASLQATSDFLRSRGVEPLVIANSASLDTALTARGVDHETTRVNLGFGPSVQFAADSPGEWDWLLIINDDVTIEPTQFGSALAQLPRDPGLAIVYLCDESARALPTRLSVFLNVSLLHAISRRFLPPQPEPTSDYFKSFSTVALSRQLWEATDGFDPAMIFTYEDADIVARGRAIGGSVSTIPNSGATHLHSVSSGAHVDFVLPVSAWSARAYLNKWFPGPALNSVVVSLALVIRVPLSPFTKAPWRKHLRGIAKALWSVARRRPPALPDFGSL